MEFDICFALVPANKHQRSGPLLQPNKYLSENKCVRKPGVRGTITAAGHVVLGRSTESCFFNRKHICGVRQVPSSNGFLQLVPSA